MPLLYQRNIDADTRLAIWKIQEPESFFLPYVVVGQNITHPRKRLQHLAGRYLLRFLFEDFPFSRILIADARRPYLKDDAFHFSISHCGNYAAAIVSRNGRVGIDIEYPNERLFLVRQKFLHPQEQLLFPANDLGEDDDRKRITLLWTAKEALYKWWGWGGISFSEALRIDALQFPDFQPEGAIFGRFSAFGIEADLRLTYRIFPDICLSFLKSNYLPAFPIRQAT